MEWKPVQLYVGVYDSRADANADYEELKTQSHNGVFIVFDAAVITKDDAGVVHVNKDEKTTRQGALVGAVVGILFPPFFVADVALGALAGHLWGGMSRADMKDVGDLLDAGHVALVVLAEEPHGHTVKSRLMRASRSFEREIEADTARIRKGLATAFT